VLPITIGEVWIRLASLCAIAACLDAGLSLASLQFGVGVPRRRKCVSHALQSCLPLCLGDTSLHLGYKNAFNAF
jgi:hypothetical protein